VNRSAAADDLGRHDFTTTVPAGVLYPQAHMPGFDLAPGAPSACRIDDLPRRARAIVAETPGQRMVQRGDRRVDNNRVEDGMTPECRNTSNRASGHSYVPTTRSGSGGQAASAAGAENLTAPPNSSVKTPVIALSRWPPRRTA